MQDLRSMLDPIFALGTSRVAVVEFDSHVELIRNFTKDASLVDDDLANLQPGMEPASWMQSTTPSTCSKRRPMGACARCC